MLAYLYWDPNPEILPFPLPFLHRGILWYGFLFAVGFFAGYCFFLYLLRRYLLARLEQTQKRPAVNSERAVIKKRSTGIAESVVLYVMIGALVGARLGDVVFYQNWAQIAQHPLSILKVWEGGLASHGGAVGMLIALWIFSKRSEMSFLKILDLVAIPTALAGVFIRIGNFFGQEILGTFTQVPWGVIFGHPAGGGPIGPRHPVQLYEALGYCLIFFFLWGYLYRHSYLVRPGRILGLFFILVFGFRFCIEYFKVEQSAHAVAALTMGQWLSIPLICAGFILIYKKK